MNFKLQITNAALDYFSHLLHLNIHSLCVDNFIGDETLAIVVREKVEMPISEIAANFMVWKNIQNSHMQHKALKETASSVMYTLCDSWTNSKLHVSA